MATKPTRKKQPFVIEPLNWVAPDAQSDEAETRSDEAEKKSPGKKEVKS
jgi:hypothetical protein